MRSPIWKDRIKIVCNSVCSSSGSGSKRKRRLPDCDILGHCNIVKTSRDISVPANIVTLRAISMVATKTGSAHRAHPPSPYCPFLLPPRRKLYVSLFTNNNNNSNNNQTVNDGVAHSHFTIPCYHISDDPSIWLRPGAILVLQQNCPYLVTFYLACS